MKFYKTVSAISFCSYASGTDGDFKVAEEGPPIVNEPYLMFAFSKKWRHLALAQKRHVLHLME